MTQRDEQRKAPRAEQPGNLPERTPSQRPAVHVSAHDLLESLPDAVVGADGDGSIAFVNLQAEQMFGYDRAEILGQQIERLLPERLHEVHRRHRVDYHGNPAARPMGVGRGLLARRKDGTEFPVEISLSPLSTSRGVQIVSTIRDVSQRREIEAERERLSAVAERARSEAEHALRIRAEAERFKNDLTTVIVHDLKNPVTGIMMLAQLLRRKGPLSDAQGHQVAQIDRTCRELLHLIANVVETPKLEAGEMPVAIEPIVLAGLVDEVAAEYGPVAQEMGRRLTVAVDPRLPPAVADRFLLKRVLANLIFNALRDGGSTAVHVDAAPEPGAPRIIIRIVDHGHGIPEANGASIFETLETRRGDPTGDTRLGLPFCRMAVERMQGHIAVCSASSTGTAFTVTLPASS